LWHGVAWCIGWSLEWGTIPPLLIQFGQAFGANIKTSRPADVAAAAKTMWRSTCTAENLPFSAVAAERLAYRLVLKVWFSLLFVVSHDQIQFEPS
jgi:hypothetical protein